MQRELSERAYAAWALFCALGYCALQIAYLHHLPLVTDELDGAYDVYRLKSQVPYLDFSPYKTVLGYYLQLPALLLGSDVWSGIFWVKYELVVLNTALTLLAAWQARPLFSRLALALALPCWLLMSNWLERSSDLRVDTLTAWPGLFSLLCLLKGRPALAGLLAALSFLISQKGIYFIVASGPLLLLGARSPEGRRAIVRFGVACLGPIALYFGAFSAIASAAKTTKVMFLSHNAIAFGEIYPNIRKFWRMSLLQNVGLYSLSVLGMIALAAKSKGDLQYRRLFAYCATLAALLIWHKQPWPYFFVLLAPSAFLVCASAFEIIGRAETTRPLRIAGLVVLAVPLLLALAQPIPRARLILRESQAYQRHMITLTAALVAGGEPYLAAMDLLYDRTQSPRALRRLSIGTRRNLEHAPREAIDAILSELRDKPPRVLVRNERFNGMPQRVRRYLQSNYVRFWGNLELYAPRIPRGRSLELVLDGRYRVDLQSKAGTLQLDGRTLQDGEIVELSRGRHKLEPSARGRLLWQPPPEVTALLDPRFKKPGELIGNAYNR